MTKKQELLVYKGYQGTVEYSLADGILFGEVIGIKSLISYEGTTLAELRQDFQGAVDDYLKMCAEVGRTPEREYKGSFNVRISLQLHSALVIYAARRHESLNASVATAIERLVTDDQEKLESSR